MLLMSDQARKPVYEELLREAAQIRRENERLGGDNKQLRERSEHLGAENDLLGARLQELEGKMQELERMAFRQAAPFRVPRRSCSVNRTTYLTVIALLRTRRKGHPYCARTGERNAHIKAVWTGH